MAVRVLDNRFRGTMALPPNRLAACNRIRAAIGTMDPPITTEHIRRAWFWLGVGFALFGTVWALAPHAQTLVPSPALLEWLRDQHEALRIVLANDKIDHAVGFALLMGWFCQLYDQGSGRVRLMVALLAQAASIEILQGYTPWRTSEIGDWVASGAGIGLGWLASSPRTPNVLRWLVPRTA